MQGKLRGDLGSALPFLPGHFINHKLAAPGYILLYCASDLEA
jgi:hypothetical protein